MEIEIATLGGYEEVGRQMTAVRAGEDIVIFDMGLNLSKVLIHDNVETESMHSLDLIDMGAIPDDRVMSELEGDVQAIVPTHGHLDHIAGIPKLAHRYDAPIVGSPYTIELVKQQIADEGKFQVDNDLVKMKAGGTMAIGDSEQVEMEFVNVTHSIIDAINPVLHTPEGAVVYGLDKRLDHTPVIGDPIDMDRFREIGRQDEGVLCYIEDCTNAGRKGRTPSESYAKKHVEDTLTPRWRTTRAGSSPRRSPPTSPREDPRRVRPRDRPPAGPTRALDGEVLRTAERLDFVDFQGDVGMYGHRKSVDRAFKRIMKEGKGNFLPIVTGHQGEPRAMLTRMGRGETPYEIENGDKVVFSASIIPEPTNEGQRYQSEQLLRMQGARLYDDIHVSGHLREEGHYEMLDALQPQHLIPAHQTLKGRSPYVDLATSQGYKLGRDVHVTQNGSVIQLAE